MTDPIPRPQTPDPRPPSPTPRLAQALLGDLEAPHAGDQTPGEIRELIEVFHQFNDFTAQMQEKYARWQAQVESLEAQLREKDEQLQRKNRLEALGTMAAGVAHEIRNPLGSIQINASLLLRSMTEASESQRLVSGILGAARHLNKIVTEMLAFTNECAPSLADCSLAAVLSASCEYIEAERRAKNQTVTLDAALDGAIVRGDESMLVQVFQNLMLNAVQAMPLGGALCLREHRRENGRLTLAVEDSGPGIPLQDMARIFNPFFSTKDRGTGLGLAIVHRILESHGATIRAENVPGFGACFLVTLPLAETQAGVLSRP